MTKKPELTFDLILEKVDDSQIFNYYMPVRWSVGGLIRSPLRKDNSPSFSIRRNKSGYLTFIDYADDSCRGNACTFVMKMFGLNYNDALERIDNDLGLGIRSEPKNIILPKPLPLEINKPKVFTLIPKDFTKHELEYWKQYSLTLEDLLKERNDEGGRLIYSVKRYFVDGQERLILPKERVFAYDHGTKGKKLYFIDRNRIRFKSGLANTFIEGFSDITDFQRIIISKSTKDRLILKRICKNVVSTQNESMIFATEENMSLINRFKRKILIYDSDLAGVKASGRIKEELGFETIFMPDPETTDAGDYIKKHGKDALINFLKQQILG